MTLRNSKKVLKFHYKFRNIYLTFFQSTFLKQKVKELAMLLTVLWVFKMVCNNRPDVYSNKFIDNLGEKSLLSTEKIAFECFVTHFLNYTVVSASFTVRKLNSVFCCLKTVKIKQFIVNFVTLFFEKLKRKRFYSKGLVKRDCLKTYNNMTGHLLSKAYFDNSNFCISSTWSLHVC